MAIITKKFSEFVAGDLNNINRVVGLSNGANAIFSSITTWTTATRPTEPANGLLGYNVLLQQYEFFDEVSDEWIQLQDGGDVAALIARLAAHTAGDGASMIGLENQGSVTNKTVQDLSEAEFIIKTNNGSLLNAQAMGVLSTGIVKNTTGTGVQSISSPLTSIDSLSAVADRVLYASGVNTYSLSVLTSYARILLAATDAANAASILEVLPLLGATMLGIIDMGNFKITNLAAPISPLDAVNKTYVDSLIINVEKPCVATTTSNLAGYTYNNGTAGVGATLTAGSNGVFSTDGYSPAITTRVLVSFQSTTFQNGVYTLTQVGSGSTPAILTRATDYNTPSQIQPGDRFTILNGTIYAGSEFIETAIVTTIGTDPITFVENSNNSYLLKSANLSDVVSASTSRTNLGLGTAATKDASDNLNSTVLSTTLTSSQLFVGNVSNVATGVALSGDASLANTGSITVSKIGGKSVSLAAAFTTSGAFAVTQTYTGITNVTFPTTGTLATTSQLPTPAALTKADDTNVTLTLGGTPATALLQATSITAGWTGQLSVSRGGTGNSSFTAYSLIVAGTTSTGTFQNVVGVGSLNQILVSQGAGALPQWSTVPGLVPAALTKTDDTNVTLTLGGSPSTALLQATSIAVGWTGQLGLTRGGSNASLTASNGGIVYSTASAMAILSGTATANQILLSGASTTPAWSTTTYPTTSALGDIIYGSNANVLSKLSGNTTAVKQYLSQTGTGTVSAAPAWATISGADITGAALTKADDTNVTLTLAGSPTTALLNATSITAGWTGTLSVARGGTGAGTFTSNGVIYGNTTSALQVTAAGTTGQVFLGVTSGAPAWGNSLNGDFTFTSSTSGTPRAVTIAHTSNTSSSGSIFQQTIAGTTASTCYHRWANTGTPEGYACGYVPSTGNWQLSYAQSAGGTPSSDFVSLILDKNQNFTYPRSSNFFTYLSGTVSNATGDNTTVTLQWGTSLWDYQTNIVSQTFTASTTAKYYHQVTILLSGLLATHTGYVLTFATSNRSYQVLASNPGVIRDTGNNLIINASVEADFDALDTATWTIEVSGGTKVVGFGGVSGSVQRTFWSGHIIG